MPIKLKTTPYLTKAGRNVKSFLAILATVSFAVIVVGWSIGYLRGYLRNPTLYNPLAITLDNMRVTGKLLPPLVACDCALLVAAVWNLARHWDVVSRLRKVKSSGYASTGLTQAQVSALDRIAVEYIRNLLGIKSDMAKNIWRNLKPGVIDTVQGADRNSHIDLNALIKDAIAIAAGGV